MLLESHLGMKRHSEYINGIRLIQHSSAKPIVYGGNWGRIVRDQLTIIVLVLLEFNLVLQKSHILTNLGTNIYSLIYTH